MQSSRRQAFFEAVFVPRMRRRVSAVLAHFADRDVVTEVGSGVHIAATMTTAATAFAPSFTIALVSTVQ